MELNIAVLERERHVELIKKIRSTGARVKLFQDGDVMESIATCIPESGVDAMFGIGAAPEGVLASTALKCMDGYFEGKLVFKDKDQEKRAEEMGATARVMGINDLVKGNNASFIATGVTDGALLKGVRFTGSKVITHSMAMRCSSKTVRFIEAIHDESILKYYEED